MTDHFRPRAPDYKLVLTKKANTKQRTVLGKGWINPAGSISLQLTPGMQLTWRDAEDCFLALYPMDEKETA